jgi:hypothetical protein
MNGDPVCPAKDRSHRFGGESDEVVVDVFSGFISG